MLEITEQARDEIVPTLRAAIVPSELGRILANIADHLANLPPVIVPVEAAPVADNAIAETPETATTGETA